MAFPDDDDDDDDRDDEDDDATVDLTKETHRATSAYG